MNETRNGLSLANSVYNPATTPPQPSQNSGGGGGGPGGVGMAENLSRFGLTAAAATNPYLNQVKR